MENEGRTQKVKLGKNEYTVVAQRHAYLERELGPKVAETLALTGNRADLTGILTAGSLGTYGLLQVFIPDLMPLWEWRGFASEKAYTETELWKRTGGDEGSDQYDKAADSSPDYDQMLSALQAAAYVNRIDLLGKLKELVGPDFFERDLYVALRAKVELEGIRFLQNMGQLGTGESGSESLPPPSGASPQGSGGTAPQTGESSPAGPSPASSTT